MSAKIDQFVSVTGANADTARKLLNACADNLELAIGMYMEDGATSTGTDTSNVDQSPIPIPLVRINLDCTFCGLGNHLFRYHRDEDEVRPPILPVRGVLVEDEPSTGKLMLVTDYLLTEPLTKDAFEEGNVIYHRQCLIHLEMWPRVCCILNMANLTCLLDRNEING